MSNRRMYARGRPQMRQRFTWRVENLGSRRARTILDFLAKGPTSLYHRMAKTYAARNGMPSALSSSNASSSVLADVTMVTSIPRICDTLS